MPYKLQPKTIQQKFADYCKKCDLHTVGIRYRDPIIEVPKPKIYCFEAFCCGIGIGEDELKEYEDNKNYKATFKDIRFAVLARKLDALVNGEGSARGLIFDLQANYGITVKKPARDQQEAMEVTLNLGAGCGDNLTGRAAAQSGAAEKGGENAVGDVGETGEYNTTGTGEDGAVVTANSAEPPPPEAAPLRPGIDYPVSLNKQPPEPAQPETGYKGYKNYASYWARHCIY